MLSKKHGGRDGKFDGGFRFQGSGDMGIDAVKKLQMHYNINKVSYTCAYMIYIAEPFLMQFCNIHYQPQQGLQHNMLFAYFLIAVLTVSMLIHH